MALCSLTTTYHPPDCWYAVMSAPRSLIPAVFCVTAAAAAANPSGKGLVMPRVAAMSTAISPVPARFFVGDDDDDDDKPHERDAYPADNGLPVTDTANLAAGCQCHCRQCRHFCQFLTGLTGKHTAATGAVSAPASVQPVACSKEPARSTTAPARSPSPPRSASEHQPLPCSPRR